MCVLDEFSEYILETRFNTSADFNTYPIQIFLLVLCVTILAFEENSATFKKSRFFVSWRIIVL